jgi:selenide,water dikinase
MSVTDLVLIGGGHVHVQVLTAFHAAPLPGIRLTLVNEAALTPYSGMLPGHLAGLYTRAEMSIDLRRLCAVTGARFIEAKVTGIDRAARAVSCAERPPIGYDILSLNTGIVPDQGGIVDPLCRLLPLKPIAALLDPQGPLLRALAEPMPGPVAIIGAGAAGIEIACALRVRCPHSAITLIAAKQIAPHLGRLARGLVRRTLAVRGIAVVEGAPAVLVEADAVRLADGRSIAAALPILATGARPAPWLQASDLPKAADGFLAVRDTLQLIDDDRVFASGDCATLVETPRPKAGVHAVRQGPVLADNLARAARGEPPRRHRPQSGFLSLLLTGRESAIAIRGSWPPFAGRAMFRLKDRIDRGFMSRFKDLYERPELLNPVEGEAMRCLGCAAKVTPEAVEAALGSLGGLRGTAAPDPAGTSRVMIGVAEADDAAVTRMPDGALQVETVDFFPAPVDDPFLAGRIAALHAVSDVLAMGARPRRALAIAMLPAAAPVLQARDLGQMLAGARAALDPMGVTLVGGHSAEGPLALGFAVAGEVDPVRLLRSTGGEAGDALVLTRALGTGLVLAAMRRGQEGPEAVDALLARMLQPQDAALSVLQAHGARALTDVTGFGLIGHLRTMLRAGRGAEIALMTVPVLAAALALARAGLRSSAVAGNRASLAGVASDQPRGAIAEAVLLDPQTCGPLLAAMPPGRADATVAALHAAGYPDAAIIGRMTASGPLRLTGVLADRGIG